jgi:hypothetical protein
MNAVKYPSIGSMASRALALLIIGEIITHLKFWRIANTYRLSDPIYQLRRLNWEINSIRRSVPTSDPTGRDANIAFYNLPESQIKSIGEDGRNYALKVFEWEKQQANKLAGAVAPAPTDNAAGTAKNGTNKKKDSTGGS